MKNRRLIYGFTLISLTLSILLNYLFPFLGLWMLFLMPLFGVIVLFPTWLVGNLCIVILVFVRYLTQYAAFSGNIPNDYLYRLVSTSIVGWLILLTMTFFIIKNKRLVEELEYHSLTDNLTQAFNRRYLEQYYEKFLTESSRQKQTLSIMLFDIDHFKKINDQFGHNAGDLVLQRLAAEIKELIRKRDVFVRMGGEEFALFLPNTDLNQADSMAERIRHQVQEVKLDHHGAAISFTISIGITIFKVDTLEQLIERADQALYQAKASGRNKVVVLNGDLCERRLRGEVTLAASRGEP
ncbi:GGDEF domain-containing protein [Ammoniphilus resinae]|uniref:Diguanylate cyclase (GGDEF)-like protein n=1 Tax=Ammoniphilus resinae TaxID=861532 RepID=A0ABS4GX18_9BACL|nr:GGDEF domain-containing protein [Ammoniphilus resinae]MBP1934420.1 diguanylate cyclase (GGDEF)-like protein [Ammoniphilus resinae]